MSFDKSYTRFEFTIGFVDQKQEVALCQEIRQLSETVCSTLAPNNMEIEWENKAWSIQKTRFAITYEEEYKSEVDKFFFKLKLQYPEFAEVQTHELTSRY